jgi:hypothetical protein
MRDHHLFRDEIAQADEPGERPAPRRCRDDDGGYVLALTALLMLPLMAFAGFAVDLGSWYAEAAKLQRTADAASLAAVSYMPDEGLALQAAQGVLERNGFDPSQGSYDPIGTQQYEVTIEQEEVSQYFTSLFVNDVRVERGATAEFINRVALGSPRNYIGTGQLLSGSLRENFELAVNGPCSGREQGDLVLPISTANFNWSSPSFRCDPADGPVANTFHNADGYWYAVRVPDDYVGPSTQYLRVYDASICSSDYNSGGGANWTTQFRIRSSVNSVLDPIQNPVLATRSFARTQNCGTGTGGCGTGTTSTWQSRWCTLYTLTGLDPGDTYFVQVSSGSSNESQHWINEYSLAVYQNQTSFDNSEACSTDPNIPPATASCIRIYAIDRLSVFAAFADSVPEFYLAEIGPEHGNKEFVISLFDVGEGTRYLEIIEPDGDEATFDWEVIDETDADTAPTAQPSGGVWNGTTNRLYADGNASGCTGGGYPQAGPHRSSTSRYNDRRIELRIDLPADITAAYGGQYWWKVRYQSCGAPSDRTTWGAGVIGDPVRLID